MDVQCKYYLSAPGHCIKCQGFIADTAVKLVFIGPTDTALEKKAQHLETYCCDQYNAPNCKMYRVIEREAVSHE